MPRPENVRCETCVFWEPTPNFSNKGDGNCHKTHTPERTNTDLFCGEWRDEWPQKGPPPVKPNTIACKNCKFWVPTTFDHELQPMKGPCRFRENGTTTARHSCLQFKVTDEPT